MVRNPTCGGHVGMPCEALPQAKRAEHLRNRALYAVAGSAAFDNN